MELLAENALRTDRRQPTR